MIQLNHFQLRPFRYQDELACKTASLLNRDPAVKNMISWRFEELLVKEPISEDKLELGKAYLIEKDGETIGMTGSSELKDGVTDLWVALLPSYRHKEYLSKYQNPHNGSKLFADMTLYMIEHIEGLGDVSVTIKDSNLGSIKAALNEGFTLYEQNRPNKVYRYFNKKR